MDWFKNRTSSLFTYFVFVFIEPVEVRHWLIIVLPQSNGCNYLFLSSCGLNCVSSVTPVREGLILPVKSSLIQSVVKSTQWHRFHNWCVGGVYWIFYARKSVVWRYPSLYWYTGAYVTFFAHYNCTSETGQNWHTVVDVRTRTFYKQAYTHLKFSEINWNRLDDRGELQLIRWSPRI